MDFSWIVPYWPLLLKGGEQTIALVAISVSVGFMLAIGLALLQVMGPRPLAWLSESYCTLLRGTPLLIQLWLLYYGIGSLLPMIHGIRETIFWPILREGFFFAAVAFTMNYAAYEAVVLRSALLAVPKGEIEAGRAFGMSRFTLLRRVWLPRAIRIALPTIAGEVVLQLKATPLAFTVTVMDLYSVAYKIRQDTLLVYEPLIIVTIFYVTLTTAIVQIFGRIERQIPVRR